MIAQPLPLKQTIRRAAFLVAKFTLAFAASMSALPAHADFTSTCLLHTQASVTKDGVNVIDGDISPLCGVVDSRATTGAPGDSIYSYGSSSYSAGAVHVEGASHAGVFFDDPAGESGYGTSTTGATLNVDQPMHIGLTVNIVGDAHFYGLGASFSGTSDYTSYFTTLDLAPGQYSLFANANAELIEPVVGGVPAQDVHNFVWFSFGSLPADLVAPTPVPEPTSALLLVAGLIAIAARRRERVRDPSI